MMRRLVVLGVGLVALVGLVVGGLALVPAALGRTQHADVAVGRKQECPPFPGKDAFVAAIDNPYLPLVPGTTFVYEGEEDGERQRNTVEVTRDKKTILGVKTTVVLDTVRDDKGELIERTLDWFAQDKAGNVWYLGEASRDYENGQVVSTKGSWEAGRNGAKPGIVMLAKPKVGQSYRQECAPPDALDAAQVVALDAKAKTPYDDFDRVLKTREWTPLEPGVVENKFYARCLGLVRVEVARGGTGATKLVDVRGPGAQVRGCKGAERGAMR